MFCVFLSYSTESTHYLTFIGPRLLSSEGILAGACVVPSAAALAVPVETGQERGQSGGTGSDFSVFRRCITSTHFRCGLGSKTTESAADLVISFQSTTFWSKHAGAGVAASGRGVLSEI